MKNNSTCGLSLFHGKLKRNEEKEKCTLEKKIFPDQSYLEILLLCNAVFVQVLVMMS